ncbi:MAG TPA: flagellar assembly protein T N-terminal domain-containing protein [Anaeromyxobacteraceae bacterium]|nr:flagellar assembly protein T N-terminal domain-containing protein [Anaeromyxobacteraceae bacterium]
MKRTLLLAALLALPAGAAEDVKTTEAEGQGPIVENDVTAARQRARDDAMRNCVQQVASTVVTAATETDQSQLLSDKVYSHSEGYIRKYVVLDDRRDGNTWVTRLRCDVAEGKLDEDLMAFGIAYRREGMPRVMVLVAEQAINATQATGWWQGGGNAADLRVTENAFMDRMSKSGFSFVDPEVLAGKVRLESVGADPNVQQAREIGRLAGAEVVVVGRAIARPVGQLDVPGGALYASVANVSARAVRTDTGQVMASSEFTSRTTNDFEQTSAGRKALSEGGRQLASDLFSKIGKAWAREQSGGRHVLLFVRGVDDYARLASFKAQMVNGVRGVKDVQERSMEDGKADLEVVVAGTSQSLATELATRRFQGFAVKVRKVTPAAVEVELK